MLNQLSDLQGVSSSPTVSHLVLHSDWEYSSHGRYSSFDSALSCNAILTRLNIVYSCFFQEDDGILFFLWLDNFP